MHRRLVTLAVALALGFALLPAAPAAAACPPPGGVDLGWVQPERAGDYHVLGRGWGHGVGMSQHGALGAARFGCTVGEILGTYYPGTSIGTETDRNIRVGLFAKSGDDGLPQRINVKAESGPIEWRFVAPDGTVVHDDDQPQPQGATWMVQVAPDGTLYVTEGADEVEIWRAGERFGRLEVRLGGNGSRMVSLTSKGGRRYRYGTLEFRPDGSSGRMYVNVDVPSIEQYLYGLAEMPSSWDSPALQAQAITGRSYAQVRRRAVKDSCQCHLVDSPADQVYAGYEKEGEATFGQRWVAAVDATAGKVLTYGGDIATGFYSSSHGGHSERLGFSSFFGAGDLGYLRPVDDSRWESNAISKVTRWAETYSRDEITRALASRDVGTVQSVQVRQPLGAGGRVGNPDRDHPDGGRYGGVQVVGSKRTVVMSGLEFIRALQTLDGYNGRAVGLRYRSELFRVSTGAALCLPTESQADNGLVTRSSGPDRVATAAAVAADHWESSTEAVLATSITFPDALSAGALAARLGAPVLLTRGSALQPEPLAELHRLGVERVHLMGGHAALAPEVEQQLAAEGFEVVRVAGPGRFDTARAAALAAGPSGTGEVALAYGGDWPDAVSAGALAASPDRIPTLLSERDAVPQVTLQALSELGAERVLLIGGSAVLSGTVVDQLRAEGYEVGRLSGPSRYATSLAVAADAAGRAQGERPVVLATGEAFPDALAAGALAARLEGGLVLTTRCDLGSIPETLEHLRAGPYGAGVVVGGTAALSDLVREMATTQIRR